MNEWISEMWAKSIKLNILTLMEIHTCDDGKFNNILFVYEMLLFYMFPFGRCKKNKEKKNLNNKDVCVKEVSKKMKWNYICL